jgi:hypothetical protein
MKGGVKEMDAMKKVIEKGIELDELMLYIKNEKPSLYEEMQSEELTSAIFEFLKAVNALRSALKK